MNKVISLTLFYCKILIKNRATPLFGTIALASLVIAYFLSNVNIVIRFKLFEDILLTSQAYLLILCALFYTFELLTRDKISGFFILPLSLGVERNEYLLTLFIAPLGILFFLFLAFLGVDFLFLYFIEGEVHLGILYQLYLFFLEAALFSMIMTLFAQYVSIMNSATYALLLYLIGNGLDELKHLFGDNIAITTLYYLFPNFSFFDMQSLVVNRLPLVSASYIFPTLYFIAYTSLIYGIAYAKYKKKVLDVAT